MSHKVLLITSKKGTLKSAETYLRNRFELIVTDDLKLGVAEAIQKHVDFVIIAADHPSRRILQLPKVLSQVINPRFIGYITQTTKSAMSILDQLHFDNVLYPPVSGPSIERMILKILKEEKEDPKTTQRRLDSAEAKVDPGVYIAKGEKQLGGVAYTPLSQRKPLQYQAWEGAVKGAMKAAMVMPEGARKQMSLMAPTAFSPDQKPYIPSTSGPSTLAYIPPPSDPGSYSAVQAAAAANADLAAFMEKDPFEGDWSATEEGKPTPAPHEVEVEKAATADPLPAEMIDENKPVLTAEQFRDLMPAAPRRSGSLPDQDSEFAKMAERALELAIQPASGKDVEKIEDSGHLTCLAIKAQKFSGYLIAALGKNRKIDPELMQQIRAQLFQFLTSLGETVTETEATEVELRPVEFEDWALEQAQFLKKAVHGEHEIAIAFFADDKVMASLEESEVENMFKVRLDSLLSEMDLNFDLYLYLPQNQRLILYTTQGQNLGKKRVIRLAESGITHLHVHKDKVPDLHQYYARLSVRRRAADFQAGQMLKDQGVA